MNMRVSKGHFVAGVAVGAVAAAMIGAGGLAVAQMDRDNDRVRVGTYTPQTAFSQYHQAEGLQRRAQEIQLAMQEAQEQGDQQRMIELQAEMQQMQMAQQQVVERFLDDVEKAVPEIAREAGVSVFAVEIVYTSDEVGEPVDLTRELVEHINNNADER